MVFSYFVVSFPTLWFQSENSGWRQACAISAIKLHIFVNYKQLYMSDIAPTDAYDYLCYYAITENNDTAIILISCV